MSKTLWSFLAIASGFATMALLISLATVLINRTIPEWTEKGAKSKRSYLLINLGYTAAAGIAGGYVTTWVARENPLVYALALAVIVLLLGALSALQLRGQQPILYQVLLTALTPVAVIAGGLLRLRVAGLY